MLLKSNWILFSTSMPSPKHALNSSQMLFPQDQFLSGMGIAKGYLTTYNSTNICLLLTILIPAKESTFQCEITLYCRENCALLPTYMLYEEDSCLKCSQGKKKDNFFFSMFSYFRSVTSVMESKNQAHGMVKANIWGGDYTRDCGMLRDSGGTAGENCKMKAVLAQFGGLCGP